MFQEITQSDHSRYKSCGRCDISFEVGALLVHALLQAFELLVHTHLKIVQGCLDVGHILQEMTTSSNSSWQAGGTHMACIAWL